MGQIFPSRVSGEMRASLSMGFQFPCFSVGGFSGNGGSQPTLPCSIQCGGQISTVAQIPPTHLTDPFPPSHHTDQSHLRHRNSWVSLIFYFFVLNGFCRFWLGFCFLDFGFVVVGGGGGVAVVNDGDDCDEMRERS